MNIDDTARGVVPSEVMRVLKNIPIDMTFIQKIDNVLPDETALSIEIESRIDRSECNIRFSNNRFGYTSLGIDLKLRHDGVFVPISYYH